MGGGVVLQFALDHPDRVLSLTLVDSALPGFTYGDETTAHIQQFMQAVQADGPRAAIDKVWLQHPFFDGVRRDPELFEVRSQDSARLPGAGHARRRAAGRLSPRSREPARGDPCTNARHRRRERHPGLPPHRGSSSPRTSRTRARRSSRTAGTCRRTRSRRSSTDSSSNSFAPLVHVPVLVRCSLSVPSVYHLCHSADD